MAKISISDLRPAAGASGSLSSEKELTQVRGGLSCFAPNPHPSDQGIGIASQVAPVCLPKSGCCYYIL